MAIACITLMVLSHGVVKDGRVICGAENDVLADAKQTFNDFCRQHISDFEYDLLRQDFIKDGKTTRWHFQHCLDSEEVLFSGDRHVQIVVRRESRIQTMDPILQVLQKEECREGEKPSSIDRLLTKFDVFARAHLKAASAKSRSAA
jgi:hypothetical protein